MKTKKIYSEALWVLGAQLATAIGSLALIRVSTEILDPATYGQLAILLTITFLISQVAIGGVNVGVCRYYTIADEAADLKGYLQVVYRYIVGVNTTLLIVTLVIIATAEIIADSDVATVTLAVALGVLTSSNSVLSGLFNSARDRKLAAFGSTGEVLARILLISVVANISDVSIFTILWCYIGASLLVLLIQCKSLIKFIKKANDSVNTNYYWDNQIARFALPFVPWNFAIWFQQSTDRWALSYFVDLKTVGVYSVLFQIGYSSLTMFFSVGLRLIQPLLYRKADKSIDEKYSKEAHDLTAQMVISATFLGCCALIVTAIFHQEVFIAIVASEYRAYSHYLPWVTLAAMLHGISEIYLIKMQAQLMARRLSIVKSSLGIFGIIISAVGAKLAGLDGVIAGMILFGLASAIAMRYFSNEKL
jgi:O-antigen/teichoic acid export membrane protein